ncbi:MAG: sulfotransferase [Novosphingobium sp.]
MNVHAEHHPASKPYAPMQSSAGPNLFIIGASKSGSSALHAYLAEHPDICMSSEKEPCFFVDQAHLQSAWPIMARRPCSHDKDAYLALWDDGGQARYRGESSVYYSQAPHRGDVAASIAAACPQARILYTVREPVTRAIGHYWQRYKEFQEPLDIEAAVRTNPLYRDTSDYALQLQAYRKHFDPSQIHVIIAEDLRSKRLETLSQCLDWLGLPPFAFTASQLADKHRSPPTSRRQRFPFVSTIRNSGTWAMARRYLPEIAVQRLRASATMSFDKKRVDDSAARAYLAEYLAPRRAEFEAMIGRRITAWDAA